MDNPPGRRSALVVEDNLIVRTIVQETFARMDFDVTIASDGAVAQMMVLKQRHRPFAFIASDWNMNLVDGLSLLRFVRQDPAFAKTPFLMLSANSQTERKLMAREFGANGYLVKPFSMETLRRTITRILSQS